MSDVLIKGIEMPKKCLGSLTGVGDCFVVDKCKTFQNTDLDTKYKIAWDNRLPNCPLAELSEHGRLIDADFLKKTLSAVSGEQRQWFCAEVGQFIDEAPTVVEATE